MLLYVILNNLNFLIGYLKIIFVCSGSKCESCWIEVFISSCRVLGLLIVNLGI